MIVADGKIIQMPTTAAKPKRVVIDFPEPLFEATEQAANELAINRSSLIRKAVERFLADMEREKLEKELEEGYLANARSVLAAANDLMGAETDLV